MECPLLTFEGSRSLTSPTLLSLRPNVFCPRHPKQCLGGFTDQDLGMVLGPHSGLSQPQRSLLEDGHIRCKQMTLLLEWVEEFEAESRHSGEAVAFSVLLGDLNFDNSSRGEKLGAGGAERPSSAC